MSKLPSSVKVGCFVYSVKIVDDLEDCEGDISSKLLRIRIDGALVPERQIEVLLHEIGHAVADLMGVSSDKEERIVRQATPHILAVLQENPALWHLIVPPERRKEFVASSSSPTFTSDPQSD